MLQLLTDQVDIVEAQDRLVTLFSAEAGDATPTELGFQGGHRNVAVRWSPSLGIWAAFEEAEGRYWNAFGLGSRKGDGRPESPNLQIVVEINSPFSGINRHVAGGFANSEAGETFVVHCGKVGGGRKGIGKASFLEFCSRRAPFVRLKDGDQEADVLVVASLDQPHAPAHIAGFVHLVDQYKRAVTSGTLAEPTEALGFNPEYEGTKEVPKRDPLTAKCDHGAVVNFLERELVRSGFLVENDVFRDLIAFRPQDRRVQSLFEVKSRGDRTSVYGAVGQLVLHSDPRTHRRVAVLPVAVSDELTSQLGSAGIDVLLYDWDDNRPVFIDLDAIVRPTGSSSS